MAGEGDQIMQACHDGKAVKLKYSTTVEDKSLLWAVVEEQSEWTKIEPEAVIVITEDDELLYMLEQQQGTDNEQKTTVLTSISRIEAPVDDLKHDFSIPWTSFLADLKATERSNNHVIVSVASGTRKGKAFSEQALQPLLAKYSIDYTLHETTAESHVYDLARDVFLPASNEGVKQHIILLSGDGGLVDILNALHTAEHADKYISPDVAIIPMGTGNALANSTGILKDKTLGLRTLVRGQPRELPSFKVTFSPGARFLADEGRIEEAIPSRDGSPTAYGCVVCSWGLHAALVADSDTQEYRKFGSDRFKMAAKEALFPSGGSSPHAYRGKISIIPQDASNDQWETIDRPSHGYVLATPVSHLEAGFNISPASRAFDGVLRLVHFEPLSGEEAMGIMGKAYQTGAHVTDERVGYEAIRAMRIEFDENDAHWRRICIDGKIARIEKDGWVEIRSEAHSGVNVVAIQQE